MAVLCWMSWCSSCRDLYELLGKGRLGAFPGWDPQRESLKG